MLFRSRKGGADSVPLEAMIGEAWVIDVSKFKSVDVEALERAWPARPVSRVLLKTRNSELWDRGHSEFVTDYAALTENTGEWLIARGIRLVGIDYLSIQRFSDPPTIHRVLLAAGVVVLEGLNLSDVAPGRYELFCLPLKLVDADGAPARAALRRLS